MHKARTALIDKITQQLNYYRQNRTARQSVYLVLSRIFDLGLSFITNNLIFAKLLPDSAFDEYSFCLSVFIFMAMVFEFGYFSAAWKFFAQNDDSERQRELFGAMLGVQAVIACVFSIATFGLSFVADQFFTDQVGYLLRGLSLVSFSYLLPFFLQSVFTGSNKIMALANFAFIWRSICVLAYLAIWLLDEFRPFNILLSQALSMLVGLLIILGMEKPSFKNMRNHIRFIQGEVRNYGLDMYVARMLDNATFKLDAIVISIFVSGGIGIYNVAYAMAHPLNLFPTAISASKFKDMAGFNSVPKSIVKATVLAILGGAVGCFLLGTLVMEYYLAERYAGQSQLLAMLIGTVVFVAASQPYLHWLTAHGKGKALRHKALFSGLLNIGLNFLLIPRYGIEGGALASLISMSLSFGIYFGIYRHYSGKLIKGS